MEMAHIFHVPENRIRVVAPDVGGGFGLKGNPFPRSEEHTSELQSLTNLVCRLLLEKKKKNKRHAALYQDHHRHIPDSRDQPTSSQTSRSQDLENMPIDPSTYRTRHCTSHARKG